MRAVLLLLSVAFLQAACLEQAGESTIGSVAETRVAFLLEEIRIDGHADNLVPIRRIAVGDNGTIGVIQEQDGIVRFYDGDGQPLGSVGGRGGGPGEFESMSNVGWKGDTLWVFDARQSRVSLVSPDFQFIRTELIQRSVSAAEGIDVSFPASAIASPRGIYEDGSFLSVVEFPTDGATQPPYSDHVLMGRTRNGQLESIHLWVPLGGFRIVTPVVEMGVPFPNQPQLEASPDGSVAVLAMALLELRGEEHIQVTTVNAAGDTLFQRAYSIVGRPIEREVRDSTLSRWTEMARSQGPEIHAAFREHVRIPEVYPPLTGMVVGRDLSIWLELSTDAGERRYFVTDGEGEALGQVVLPVQSRIAAAFLEQVWVIERDELDVESLVRYRVDWR
jgi:hypothetical protein